MSSRKEEKERLRREREEFEAAHRASEGRRRRIGIVLGTVLLAAVALVVVLAVASGDDEGSNQTSGGNVAVPAKQISDLDEAAKAAGCKVAEHPSEGRGHVTEDVQYKTNPPTSGSHDPSAAQDGVYPEPPDLEQSVHSLEHGRVNVQFKAGTPQNRINQLETMVGEEVEGTGGFHTLLFENQTSMTAAVAATSWTRSLTCPTFDDKVFDAIRAFREKAIAGEWEADIPEPIP
ncbi:MAG TPA: DUF3105 domain-containing protein [Solirubrobacteraceae bacterium]|nr:DUF3105 domain-containing protein [Solirubrobacteraceae bacterium]